MKKIDLPRSLVTLLLFLAVLSGQSAKGQLVYGCSPFQDSMWAIDTTNWSVAARIAPSLSGFTITGITGMAYDPIGHETFVIMKLSGVTNRVLGTMDLNTGVCTQIGNLGDKFSSISFREDGQLFGVTGNGATVPETMFVIDKTNATTTLAVALGNGADGEIICYNRDDDMFYHWSGNGTIVFEKFPATAPYTPVTNIPLIGPSHGETFGAMYLDNGNFLVSNISSSFEHVGVNGQYGSTFGSNPDDLRGVVMVPTFLLLDDTICLNEAAAMVLKNASTTRDTAVYVWGDGNTTTIFPAAGATHSYATTGNYTSYAILKNATVGSDTIYGTNLRVNALPVVVLTPGADTLLCTSDSLVLTGASGGTLQWLMNGTQVVGADSSSYSATVSGWYNQTKTNQNGCTDSAAVGIMLTFGDQPVVDLGADSTLCDGDSICLGATNPSNVTYLWSTGATSDSLCFSTGNTYTLTAMDSLGCTMMDDVTLSFLLTPDPNPTIDSSNCPTFVFIANDPNGTSWLWDFGDGNTGSGSIVSHTYTANGTYTGSLVSSNLCFADTTSGSVDVSCIVGLHEGLGNGVTISPNPNNGTFLLKVQMPATGNLGYQVTDLNGRKLLDWKSDDLRTEWSERVSFQPAPGIYFLTVDAGAERSVYRIVIQ